MELISIIVPVYNVCGYLEKCLLSITEQTYKNIEIIIVDDGSSDGSEIICDSFAERDSRIKLIRQENKGVAAARNAALDAVSGEYIMFVDADDYIENNTIEFLLSELHKHSADISICSFTYTDTQGHHSPCDTLTVHEGIVTQSEFWNYFFADRRVFYVALWAKLYKKSIWDNVRFPVDKLHEDEFVTHYIIEKSRTITLSKLPLYHYVQREGSIMHKEYNSQNLDAAEGMLARCEFFIGEKEYKTAEKSLSMAMYSLAKGYTVLNAAHKADNNRVDELYKKFRFLYKRLFFKRTNPYIKLKCGIFFISMRMFIALKK